MLSVTDSSNNGNAKPVDSGFAAQSLSVENTQVYSLYCLR